MERLDQISGCIDDLARISDALTGLDDYWLPSNVNKLLKRREVLRLERLVIQTLQALPATELNYALKHTKLGLLFYKVKDHRGGLFGIERPGDLGESLGAERYHHRTQLVELLAVQRVTDLSIARAGSSSTRSSRCRSRRTAAPRTGCATVRVDEGRRALAAQDDVRPRGRLPEPPQARLPRHQARSRRRGARGRENGFLAREARASARSLPLSRPLSTRAEREETKTRAP